MRILVIALSILLPSVVMSQSVSRTELRNTNNILLTAINSKAPTNSPTLSSSTHHGTTKVGTNGLIELRVQDDNGGDAFGVQLRGYHGMAAPSWSLGYNITWAVPDESGFAIGMSLTVTNVQDPTIIANGSTLDNTMVGLGYGLLATNGSFAIGRNNRSWGANAGTLGVGLSNGVANTIDIGLHDPTKLSVGTNRLDIRTPVFASNLSSNATVVSFIAKTAGGEVVETESPSGAALSQTLQNIADATVQRQTNQSGLAKDSNIQFMNAAETVLIDVSFNSSVLDFPQGFTAASAVINSVDLDPWLTFLAIADPNADRIVFWDDSESAFKYMDPASLGGGADFYGQNATTNLTVINHAAASGAYLVLSNAAGDQLNFISYYHGSAAPATSLSFDTIVSSNTYRLFPGALTSFPPFLTMDRMGRSLMLGYGGSSSVTVISNKANTVIQSNLVVNGTTSLEGGVSLGGGAGILHLLTMTNTPTDSNFVANFDAGNKQFWFPAEANINIPHATNVSGNWSTSKVVSVYLDLRGKAFDGILSWPTTFNRIGVATTNNAVLTSNKIHRLALENYGPGQTNTDIAIGYGQ